ncbi:MAG: beta-lactamase family protein [Deltaproteobacteria bacterium]|nr:beta-lactamase family protein [Deltaproteobacteria bacterium]
MASDDGGGGSDAGGDGGGATSGDAGEDGGGATSGDAGTAQPCTVASGLDGFINAAMADNNIPGLSAGIVGPYGLVWSKGYGHADIDAGRLVTADTIFPIMSISKVVTAVGVMQLVEAGRLNLDTNINTYLQSMQLVHPSFPSVSMTARHLLTHTSGIAGDDYGVLQLNIKSSDAEVQPLGEMLAALLTPQGSRYADGGNFSSNAPGTTRTYASIGTSLAGYVAESIADAGFDNLTKASIFDRLGMVNTSWRLSPYDNKRDQLAVGYTYNATDGTFVSNEPFTFSDYPAGSIRTTVPELARFIAALINDGTYAGQAILLPATVAAMRVVQYPDASVNQAVGWTYTLASRTLLGHGGDDVGASTDFKYDVNTKKGAIILMNVTRRPNTDTILDRLLTESDACQ